MFLIIAFVDRNLCFKIINHSVHLVVVCLLVGWLFFNMYV